MKEMEHNLLAALMLEKCDWKIKIWFSRMWNFVNRNMKNQLISVGCIFLDEEFIEISTYFLNNIFLC